MLEQLFRAACELFAPFSLRNQIVDGCEMLFAQPIQNQANRRAVVSLRASASFNQLVCYTAHCGYDDHNIVRHRCIPNNLRHIPNAAGVRDRRSAKLHDLKRLLKVGASSFGGNARNLNARRMKAPSLRSSIESAVTHVRGIRASENACRRFCCEYHACSFLRMLTQARINSGLSHGTS